MLVKYIGSKTAKLFNAVSGNARSMVLIYGDEVEVTGAAQNDRLPVNYRGRDGFISSTKVIDKPVLEMYFIDVGQGDSTFIVTPKRKKILIDGGINKRALGFLSWKYRLDLPGSKVKIDLLVLSHADDDHLAGLIPILQHPGVEIKKIVHNGIIPLTGNNGVSGLGQLDATGSYLTQIRNGLDDLNGLPLTDTCEKWKQAIKTRDIPFTSVYRGVEDLAVGESTVKIKIIAPVRELVNGQPVLKWFGDDAHTINGHSVVVRLDYKSISALFCGDINKQGCEYLLGDPIIASSIASHIFKAPHHGSREYDRNFLMAVRPQISIISSGDEPDHGHPSAAFIGGVGAASRSMQPLLFSTEIAATFVEAGNVPPPASPGGTSSSLTDANRSSAVARQLFKRRLHGMINVRTDGKKIFAARRVSAGYWWEAYEPFDAEM